MTDHSVDAAGRARHRIPKAGVIRGLPWVKLRRASLTRLRRLCPPQQTSNAKGLASHCVVGQAQPLSELRRKPCTRRPGSRQSRLAGSRLPGSRLPGSHLPGSHLAGPRPDCRHHCSNRSIGLYRGCEIFFQAALTRVAGGESLEAGSASCSVTSRMDSGEVRDRLCVRYAPFPPGTAISLLRLLIYEILFGA